MMSTFLTIRMETPGQVKQLGENARAKKWKGKSDLIRALADNVDLIPQNPLKK